MTDRFLTIKKSGQGDFRDRGSKFLAWAVRCHSEDDMKSVVSQLQKQHPSARHFCFGYSIGFPEQAQKSSDDGEPSGTAGLPILNQILSSNVSNVLVVVVRYFGGTKLGKSGLINAYKEAAKMALDDAVFETLILSKRLCISYDYDQTGTVLRIIDQIENSQIENHEFGEQTKTNFTVPKSLVAHTLTLFNHLKNVSIEKLDQ
jgi:uncharacterized YigZ family protein